MVIEIDAVDGLAESAVGLDSVGCDGTAVVVGNEGRVAGRVDGDVSGPGSAGGYLAGLLERAGLRIDHEGGGGGGGIVDGIDGVEAATPLADGSDGEKGGPGGGGGKDGCGQFASGRVKVRLIDAFADVLRGIGANVNSKRGGRRDRLLLPERPRDKGLCLGVR